MSNNKERQDNKKPPRFRLFVDADSCPVIRDIVNLCESQNGEVFLISNFCHEYSASERTRVISVDKSPEAADIAIFNRAKPGDIAVTQDLGAACMLLGKKVRVISPRGAIYSEQNLNHFMEMRHILKKERRKSRINSKTKPFTESDRKRFAKNLKKLISEAVEKKDDDQGD